ncbi:hypothetical protein Agub_g1788, partial [Astrephomene gubernaculifera]
LLFPQTLPRMSHSPCMLRGARALFRCARFESRAPTSGWAGYANAAVDETSASQPSTSGQGLFLPSNQLTAASVGGYYALEPRLLPEASRAYAGAFYAPRDAGHERRGGCKALQHEVEATGTHAVMYRPVMHTLYNAVGERSHQRLLLTGPAGAGKSIALAGLVEWARQQGWIVMYVPSCSALVRGGYFSPRGDTGTWDTLTSAQQLLKGMLDAHGPQLKSLPVLAPAQQPAAAEGTAADAEVGGAEWAAAAAARGKTLYDVVTGGLTEDDNAQLAVDSALAVVQQLVASSGEQPGGSGSLAPPVQVLFALDDYNCLYGSSDYGVQPPSAVPIKARRRVLQAQELNLARGMRLLEAKSLGGAAVVAATTTAMPLPAPKQLPPQQQQSLTELLVPGFSEVETRNALAHYHATRHATELATSRQARELFALTQGNARELRISASTLGLRLA